jgi:hypothetical protein
MKADELRTRSAERRRVGWESCDAMTPDEMEDTAMHMEHANIIIGLATGKIHVLLDLIRRADNVIAWETTPLGRGFQEEIEAALK